MTAPAEAARPAASFLSFLRSELAVRPGRLAAVVRIAACSTAVVVISMVFRIPLPAYSAYIVFLITAAESTSTLVAVAGGLIAATLAVGLSIVLYAADAAEPALRLPLMAGAVFAGMFATRTISVGPVAFLASFVLVVSQSLIDDVPNLEALTHLILWLWVVVTVPAVLTAIVNLAFAPNAAQAARKRASEALGRLIDALRGAAASNLQGVGDELAALAELREKADLARSDLRSTGAVDQGLIECLDQLARLVSMLPDEVSPAVRARLASSVQTCRIAFDGQQRPAPFEPLPSAQELEHLDGRSRPIVVAIANVLRRLGEGLQRRLDPAEGRAGESGRAMMVPDAFSNPEHVRFALKTTIAVMGTYILYTAVDWPGIRTCIVTCFFVALATTGESLHKLTLRLVGALVGAAIASICVIWLMPRMSDIGELALLVAAVSAGCAWVSTGSDLIAYAGMQAAFAFFIGALQGLTPPTELTVLRDRIDGILIGNLAMAVVFMSLWPVSSTRSAREAIASVYRSLAQRVLASREKTAGEPFTGPVVAGALKRARRLVTVSSFEEAATAGSAAVGSPEQRLLNDAQAVAAATLVWTNQSPGLNGEPSAQDGGRQIADWLSSSAARLSRGEADLAPFDGVSATPAVDSTEADPASEARRLLISTIVKVAPHAA